MNAASPKNRAGEAVSRFEIVFVHEEQFSRETAPVDG
jgi:hypothetical protein